MHEDRRPHDGHERNDRNEARNPGPDHRQEPHQNSGHDCPPGHDGHGRRQGKPHGPDQARAEGVFVNHQKARRGLVRLWHATGYSWRGLQAGWQEPAFRLEVLLALVLLPLSFWLGRGWLEVAVLAGSVMLLLIVELLNTAIEAVVDRIGPQWHPLSGRAKDMGSAAVLLATLLMIGIWVAALWQRLAAA